MLTLIFGDCKHPIIEFCFHPMEKLLGQCAKLYHNMDSCVSKLQLLSPKTAFEICGNEIHEFKDCIDKLKRENGYSDFEMKEIANKIKDMKKRQLENN